MPVTLENVATAAGVSRSAASAVLGSGGGSGSIRVSPATRQRIIEAAKRLGYQSNPLARALRGGKTMSVGILWSLSMGHSEGVVRDLTLRAQRRGYLTHLSDHLTDFEVTRRLLSDLTQRRVDAVVLDGGQHLLNDPQITALLKECPAVTAVSASVAPLGVDQVVQDRLEAIRAVADHFFTTGRRHPVLAIAADRNPDKVGAFWQRFEEHGVRTAHGVVNLTDFHRGLGMSDDELSRGLAAQFAAKPRPDAIWCGTDETAVAVLYWLAHHGLRVPQDVAVVGFNDAPFAAYQVPALASVARRDDRLAEVIDQMLFSRLENPSLPPRVELVPMEFVWRDSAG